MTHSIDIDGLSRLLSSGAVTLLDVRRKLDYDTDSRTIAGATWRDPEKIDTWIKQLPAGNLSVVYCVKGGSVSRSVMDRLRRQGLDAVLLEGGIKNWIDNGQPLEAVPAAPKR